MTISMKQFTKEEAEKIYYSNSWKKLTDFQLAGFQLYQNFVFCDFGKFHNCLNKSLNRGQEDSKLEGVRFRQESREELQKQWENLHDVPNFLEMKSILLKQ